MSISMHHLRHKKQEKNPLPPSLGVRGDNIAQTTANRPYMIIIWIRNIVGNAILLPMGILLPLLWTKFRKIGRVTLFAFLFSLGIETLQLLFTLLGNIGRAFDVDDILLNTLGAFIGSRREIHLPRGSSPRQVS